MSAVPEKAQSVITQIDRRLDDEARVALIRWLQDLLELRERRGLAWRKALKAIQRTDTRESLGHLARVGAPLKDLAWDDRTWAARLGLTSAAIAAATTAGQGAGIALLGTAIGVPLYVVLGAGGSFAGMLIDELERSLAKSGERSETHRSRSTNLARIDDEIPDAEWSLDEEDARSEALPILASESAALETEFLALASALEDPARAPAGVLSKALKLLRRLGRRRRWPWRRATPDEEM